ncbi:hypothetical protein Hte_009173 [Hypoxylon texense]
MDPDADFPFLPPASQASSPFPLAEPVSGATLYELEVTRREKLRRRGRIRTGCVEIDETVLLGGFERGSVVGVSAEDGDFGLLVGLQTAARAVVFGTAQRAAIITTLAAQVILPTLRDVIKAQVTAKLGPAANQQQAAVNAEVRRCLEQISVSRVFDIEGLWEVMSELETPSVPAATDSAAVTATPAPEGNTTTTTIEDDNREMSPSSSSSLSVLESPESPKSPSWEQVGERNDEASADPVPPPSQPRAQRTIVSDSEDDEGEALELSQPSSSSPYRQPLQPLPSSLSLPALRPPTIPLPTPALPQELKPADENKLEKEKGKEEGPVAAETAEHHVPDLILVTHFSALLTNLFTRAAENKASAHTTLQLLSSHLRYLARSPTAGGPLIMLLNSTTTTTTASTHTHHANTTSDRAPPPPPPPAAQAAQSSHRPLDPTLRSIFNSAPPSTGIGLGGRGATTGSSSGSSNSNSSKRTNKPAFGVTFAQFLDLHLLCTRVPRSRADAEALFGGAGAGAGAASGREVRHSWVVEVLLDELGVWDEVEDGSGRGEGENKGQRDRGRPGGKGKRKRKSREQRWGAVDVRGGAVVVDSFPGGWQQQQPQAPTGPVRLAAGFGGPPARRL